MKTQVLKALEFPRSAILQIISARHCHRGSYYHATDPACELCWLRQECRWLSSQNDFIALDARPVSETVGSLIEAIKHLDAHRLEANHNALACCCESCRWLRSARRLLKQSNLMKLR
jgi:hypothetical protein